MEIELNWIRVKVANQKHSCCISSRQIKGFREKQKFSTADSTYSIFQLKNLWVLWILFQKRWEFFKTKICKKTFKINNPWYGRDFSRNQRETLKIQRWVNRAGCKFKHERIEGMRQLYISQRPWSQLHQRSTQRIYCLSLDRIFTFQNIHRSFLFWYFDIYVDYILEILCKRLRPACFRLYFLIISSQVKARKSNYQSLCKRGFQNLHVSRTLALIW